MPFGTRSKLNLVRREDFGIPVKKRKKIIEICKEQTQKSKFAFVHDGHPNDFAMSQWPIGIFTYFFYRLSLIIFFFIGIILEISYSAKHGGLQAKWLIEIHNWDVLLLLTYLIVAVAVNIKFHTSRTNIRPITGITTQCRLNYYDSHATSLGFQDDAISRIEEERSQADIAETVKSKIRVTSNSGSEGSGQAVKTRKEPSEVTFVQGDIGLPTEHESKTSKFSRTSILKPITPITSNVSKDKGTSKAEIAANRSSASNYKRKFSIPIALRGEPVGYTVSEMRPISRATSGGTDVSRVPLKLPSLPWYIKLHWLLFSVCTNSAIMNAFLHWTVFENEHNPDRIHVDVFKHIMNAIIMTVDIIIVGFPLNFLHFWHTTVYFSTYTVFAITYSLAGGKGPGDQKYINEYLNFDTVPFLSIIYVVVFVVLLVPTVQLFCFAMFIVRMFLYKLYSQRRDKSKPSVTS